MKVAILGTWHVHTKEYTTGVLNNPNAEVAVVWDNDAERGKKFADEMNLPFNADLDAVLGDESIDSVVICTATCDHPEVMMKVTAAKKNIFTEKVLALTNEDAQEIAQAIRESGVTFTISYPHKCRPALKAAKALVESGKLGQITYARVHNYHNGSVEPQADGSLGWLPPHFYDEVQTLSLIHI